MGGRTPATPGRELGAPPSLPGGDPESLPGRAEVRCASVPTEPAPPVGAGPAGAGPAGARPAGTGAPGWADVRGEAYSRGASPGAGRVAGWARDGRAAGSARGRPLSPMEVSRSPGRSASPTVIWQGYGGRPGMPGMPGHGPLMVSRWSQGGIAPQQAHQQAPGRADPGSPGLGRGQHPAARQGSPKGPRQVSPVPRPDPFAPPFASVASADGFPGQTRSTAPGQTASPPPAGSASGPPAGSASGPAAGSASGPGRAEVLGFASPWDAPRSIGAGANFTSPLLTDRSHHSGFMTDRSHHSALLTDRSHHNGPLTGAMTDRSHYSALMTDRSHDSLHGRSRTSSRTSLPGTLVSPAQPPRAVAAPPGVPTTVMEYPYPEAMPGSFVPGPGSFVPGLGSFVPGPGGQGPGMVSPGQAQRGLGDMGGGWAGMGPMAGAGGAGGMHGASASPISPAQPFRALEASRPQSGSAPTRDNARDNVQGVLARCPGSHHNFLPSRIDGEGNRVHNPHNIARDMWASGSGPDEW